LKYKAVEDYADNGAFAGLSVINIETGERVGIVEDPQSIAEDKRRIKELEAENAKIKVAKEIILEYGGIDGDHHKQWLLDQTLRILCGDDYELVLNAWRLGEDGPFTYEWDEGIAP